MPQRPAASGRPTKARSAAMDDELLDVARALFCARGVASTSMEAVAGALNWSKHTLYSRYGGKLALLEAVVARDVERFAAALAKAGQGEPLAALKAMARCYFGFSVRADYAALYGAIMLEAAGSPILRERLTAWAELSLAPLRQGVAKAVAGESEEICAVLIDLLDGEGNRVKWAGNGEDTTVVDRHFEARWQIFLRLMAG